MLTNKQKNAAFPCTVTAGQTDRGHDNSPFEAISFNNRDGKYLRTRHRTRDKAMKRLVGNHLHSERSLTDHTERRNDRGQIIPPITTYP